MTIFTPKGIEHGWLENQDGWADGMNLNLRRLNAMAAEAFSHDPGTTSGLAFGYRGGITQARGVWSIAASGTVLLPDNEATVYIERTPQGVVTANTTGFSAELIPVALATTAGGAITNLVDARAFTPPTDSGNRGALRILERVRASRITTGAYSGAFRIDPIGYINWYFANLALLNLMDALTEAEVQGHLDRQIALFYDTTTGTGEPDWTPLHGTAWQSGFRYYPYDVRSDTPSDPTDFYSGTIVKQRADSHDSYAATFLMLAAAFARSKSGGVAWWDANIAAITNALHYNLAVPAHLIGGGAGYLVATFQDLSVYPFLLTMDNIENLRGMQDAVDMMISRGGSQATTGAFYQSFIDNIQLGLHWMWKDEPNAAGETGWISWYYDTTEQEYVINELTSWYPELVVNAFPALWNVAMSPQTSLAEARAQAGLNWLSKAGGGPWWKHRNDPFPWSQNFVAAARLGYHQIAREGVDYVQRTWALDDPGKLWIHELGWLYAADLLSRPGSLAGADVDHSFLLPFVVHGDDPDIARVPGDVVLWLGDATPANALPGDLRLRLVSEPGAILQGGMAVPMTLSAQMAGTPTVTGGVAVPMTLSAFIEGTVGGVVAGSVSVPMTLVGALAGSPTATADVFVNMTMTAAMAGTVGGGVDGAVAVPMTLVGALAGTSTVTGVASATLTLVGAMAGQVGDPPNDTFTASNGTNITARAMNSGHNWTVRQGTSMLIQTNRAYTADSIYVASVNDWTPPSADYRVEADLYQVSGAGGCFVIARATGTGLLDYYRFGYSGSTWSLQRVIDGTSTSLGTYAQTLSNATSYRMRLEVTGTGGTVTLKGYVGGTLRIDVTDSDASRIVAAGHPGLRANSASTTTGRHADNFQVTAL